LGLEFNLGEGGIACKLARELLILDSALTVSGLGGPLITGDRFSTEDKEELDIDLTDGSGVKLVTGLEEALKEGRFETEGWELGESLGLGGILLKLDKDVLILLLALTEAGLGGELDAPTLIKGKLFDPTNEGDTGIGEGAGDNDGIFILLIEATLWEDTGVATGLGVELNDVLTVGFKSVVLEAPALVF
jgi:hypothetical protein